MDSRELHKQYILIIADRIDTLAFMQFFSMWISRSVERRYFLMWLTLCSDNTCNSLCFDDI